MKVSINQLERAIELIKQGKPIEAQKLLKPLIAENHHNLPAWFWFIETCSTNKQRINVLEICLEYNPENEQVRQALEKLKTLPPDQLLAHLPKPKNGHFLETSQGKYKPLIKLSVISASIIAAINLWVYFLISSANDEEALFSLVLFVLPAAACLSLPATAVVYLIYFSRYKKGISPIVGIGIALIINLIGVYSPRIYFQARDLQRSFSKSIQYQDLNIEIKSETIVPWRPNTAWNESEPYSYQVVLHVNNPSQKEIYEDFISLGAYNTPPYKKLYYDSRYIAHGYYDSIPLGESDILIDMPIGKYYLQCDNENFAKRLYLLYSIDDGLPRRIAVSNSINQELVRLTCGSTP